MRSSNGNERSGRTGLVVAPRDPDVMRCLQCGHLYARTACDHCGDRPVREGGFAAFAPALARRTSGYENEYFLELGQVEAHHFWFRERRRLILAMLKRYCPSMRSFLEIGCGTGQTLAAVHACFPRVRLVGSEILSAGLGLAAQRVPGAELVQMDARNIPYVDEFDAIGAFDVLEHIDDDLAVLGQMRAALDRGGTLLLTVPQHPWLWSATDEYSRHVRRYDAAELHGKIARAGFRVLRSTSFVTLLLPLLVLSRASDRLRARDRERRVETDISPRLNRVLGAIQRAEVALLETGLSLPVGGSRLVVAVRK